MTLSQIVYSSVGIFFFTTLVGIIVLYVISKTKKRED